MRGIQRSKRPNTDEFFRRDAIDRSAGFAILRVMLQFYDKVWSTSLLALAALATPALANTNTQATCDLSDGLATTLPAYVAEASACLGDTASADEAALADGILALSERQRARANLKPLASRSSLAAAARLHAMDMAARGYAAHADPEGRRHDHRIRMLDRTLLFGASGGNVVVIAAGADPITAYNAIVGDEVNRANIERTDFTHTGVGVAEADGRLYIVQLFVQGDGELSEPLAVTLPRIAPIRAEFSDARFEQTGWHLQDASGTDVARGLGARLGRHAAGGEPLYLEIEARLGTDEYSLNGPAVSSN